MGLLCVKRDKNQQVMIGDDIVITVIDIVGTGVRLGINAPNHIPIHRKEVYERIKAEEDQSDD